MVAADPAEADVEPPGGADVPGEVTVGVTPAVVVEVLPTVQAAADTMKATSTRRGGADRARPREVWLMVSLLGPERESGLGP